MNSSKQLQASKTISAPADQIFALLADPSRHTELDDSGMLRGPKGDAKPIAAVGQTFTMNMHNDMLEDYRMVNTVTSYEPDSRIGWGPAIDPTCESAAKVAGIEVGGHTYTYDLRPVDGGTEVTQTYDWSAVKDPKFEEMFPLVSQEQLAGTLDKIDTVLR